MVAIGDPAPNFSGTDLKYGGIFDLAAQAGKVVLVVFGGNW
jgi:hypothetical protein